MNRALVSVALSALVLSASPSAAVAKKPPRLAVFEIEDAAKHLSDVDRTQLTDYLSSKISETGEFRVIPRSRLKGRLQQQKKESYKDCYDQQCQIEIGRELAANKALATKLIKLGGSCTITLTLHDLRTATSEGGASSSGQCGIAALVALANNAAKGLLVKYQARTTTAKPATPAKPEPPKVAATPALAPAEPIAAPDKTDEPTTATRKSKTTWGYVALGLGVASAATAAVMYGIGFSGRSDAYEKYSAAREQTEIDAHWADVESAQTKITVGHVFTGVAVGAIGVSLYLFLTRPAEESAAAAMPRRQVVLVPTPDGVVAGYIVRF